ncbi:hypothetical protein GOP47_0005078 [Adiantum capillus-veneris]|uniref:Poly [ADP-ribose] polymerase n=1 Tax=Adiantum capillus-veneris TaxID=13818 RepID=A0A9D4ZL90_ADICA|nr:hypothetical protein GOP47_0005078 [Adiantum capillus-veneris]
MTQKNSTEGLRPACRTPYVKEEIVSITAHSDRVNDVIPNPGTMTAKAAEGRKYLSNARVLQRNMVYIVGIPAALADEEMLEQKEYFGQYGKIVKILVLKDEGHSFQHSSAGCSVVVYVTYVKEEDALRCIQSVNGYVLGGSMLKACFGTTKDSNACLQQMEEGPREDKYPQEQTLIKCGRKRISEADWDNGRVESCGSGDNFSSNSSGSQHACSWVQNRKAGSESCKRCKFDAVKIKDEVSVFPETETSSVESTSGLTVGGEAFTHTESSVDMTSQDFAFLGDKIIKLGTEDHEFRMVQEKFYTGLGMLASFATIKGIFKDCHRSTSGQARLLAFRRQVEITRAARGDSNVRYAWHGTSKPGISVIVLHGFGQPRIPKNGAMYGVGVYLAPEDYSHVSAVYSDVDENGEQHMVLCRVIMGNMEQVEQGSEQFHPTSEDYDTGVDDICNPRRYVVWTTHMNTHILLEYIVSFKLAPPWNDIIATLRGKHLVGKSSSNGKGLQHVDQLAECKTPPKTSCATCIPLPESFAKQGEEPKNSSRAPRSPWMSFPMLFLVMKAKLSEAQMCELQQHYLQFKVGRMPREELIKVVRSIAGDRLLADSIRSMQAQERANKSGLAFNGNGAGERRDACHK